nr:E-beta-farnesene synthase [Tanacetum cinerariifolium]
HVLGYLKFSAKGTKPEVFGIHIPDNLITADIQGEPYYQEYLEKVAKHQRYLVGEQGSDLDSPTPKPAKATKKSKLSVPKVDLRPPVTKPALSQQPKPKPAPAKSKGKKRKLITEKSDKPSSARISKPGLVTKRRKPTSSLRSVDEFVAEGIPEKEPRFDDEEADVQRILEESLKSIYDAPRGPLPPGKEKVTDEHVALDLLTLQTPKKKSPADQFIFQRRTITPTRSFGHDESSSLYAELGLTDSEVESDEDVPGMDAGVQDEGQAIPNPDEGFTATAYPKVEENLKLMVEEQVILEEPASYTGTLSSLQHLAKDLSFGNLFFNDKPSKADNEKTTVETEAESMVSVIIQQDTSAIPPMTTPIGKLKHIMANLIQDNRHLEERLDSHGARLYTLENLDIPQQVSKAVDEIFTNAVDWAIQASLRNRFRDLPEADMKEIFHQKMWETNSYKTHKDHMMLYEALEKSMNRDHTKELLKDLVEARKKKKKRRDSLKTPPGSSPHQPPPPSPPAGPSRTLGSTGASRSSQVSPLSPPPPSTNQEGQSHGSAAPSSSKTAALTEYKAWTMTDTRLRSSISSTLVDLQMDDDMAPDAQVHSSNDEDIGNAHIPKVNLRQDWWKPLEEDRLATSKPAWSIPSSDVPVPKNTRRLLLRPPIYLLQRTRYSRRLYQMEECHKLLTDSVDDPIIKDNVSKPLPLGGPPGQVTIQSDFFFNKDLEYLRYGSKGSRPPLLILKIKAAYYPDVGLEEMVPDQMWIEEECKYDIAAMYDISHWWFQRQRFYIDRHTSKGDRRAVRTHMRILKRDFKYLYPSDFKDLYLLNLQEDFQLGIESYQTQLNIKNPRWATTVFEYKHDYMVIDSPRADTFWDRYGVQMIMGFNEIHKFSDGTLHQIDEALDYRVKEFKVNRMNPGLNTRFWTRKCYL